IYLAALSAAAVAAPGSGAFAAQRRQARPPHLQDHRDRVSLTYSDDRLRSLLGEPDLGLVLELGSKRNLGGHYLAGVCRLSAHAHHPRMAWPSRRLLRHPRLCGGDVHFLWCDLSPARTARLCITDR